MRKFFTVLSYSLKGSNALFFRGKRGGYIPVIFPIIFFTISFGFPVYLINLEGFRRISAFGFEKLTLFSISSWSFAISLLSIASFSPHLIYTMNFAEESKLLSTLPLSKFSLVMNSLLVSLFSNTLLPIAYVFGFMGYASAVGVPVSKALLPPILNVVFILSVSLLIAVSISRISGPGVKRLNLYVFLFDLIILVVMIQLNPVTLGVERFAEALSKFTFMMDVLMSNLNPFYWPILALKEPIYNFYILISSSLSTLLAWFISKDLDLSPRFSSTSSKRVKPMGIFMKDVKLSMRKEQFFFFVVYPVVFSVIYGHFTENPNLMVSINSIFGIFYTSVMSATMVQMELSTDPLYRTYPKRTFEILFPKVFIPFLVYNILNVSISVYALTLGFNYSDFLRTIVFMAIAYLFASVMGVKEYLKNPGEGRVVLPISSVLKVEFLSVFSVFLGLVYPLNWRSGGGIFSRFEIVEYLILKYGFITVSALMIVSSLMWIVTMKKLYERS